jgi:hypothetical protein
MHCLLRRSRGFLAVVLGVFVVAAIAQSGDVPPTHLARDEELLRDARIPTDGPGLLEFIRKKCILSTADMDHVESLIKRLGDNDFRKREQATTDLKVIGSPALPVLRWALRAEDAETSRRAADIIEFIHSGTMSNRICAAVRLLRHRRPDGVVPVLIDYLPYVQDSIVEEEVLDTLMVLGIRTNEVDPALVAALRSRAPAQRAVAVMLVGWAGTPEQRLAVKEMFNDADATVRFRAAQGILSSGDKAAVPALISLLESTPLELSQRTGALLQCVAGSAAPSVGLGESEASRALCAAAWRQWSTSNLARLDLAGGDLSLPILNTRMRVNDTALGWVRSVAKGDPGTWKKTADIPFALVDHNFHVFTRNEELDAWFQRAGGSRADMSKATFVVKDVVSAEQYLKSGMSGVCAASKSANEVLAFLFPTKSYL